MRDFTTIKALVIGDVMLDQYWYGQTQRISPEAPVPIVKVGQQDARPGGAGNVALNLKRLGVNTRLLGWVGADAAADELRTTLDKCGVDHTLLVDEHAPTITKLRIFSQNQQLIRMDFEERFQQADALTLSPDFVRHLDEADIVILSDYQKGCLADPQSIIAAASALNKPVLVDPKGDDFSKYHGATVVTPNLKEFEAIVGPCLSEDILLERGQRLLNELGLSALLITRGSQGMTLLQQAQAPQYYRAQAQEVYDVTGAGDTVIAVLAAGLAHGDSLHEATALANTAAGLVVNRLGAATVTMDELLAACNLQQQTRAKHIDEEQLTKLQSTTTCVVFIDDGLPLSLPLLQRMADAKAAGDTTVVTLNNASRLDVFAAIADVDAICVVEKARHHPEPSSG